MLMQSAINGLNMLKYSENITKKFLPRYQVIPISW
jgi:hypothetical protein